MTVGRSENENGKWIGEKCGRSEKGVQITHCERRLNRSLDRSGSDRIEVDRTGSELGSTGSELGSTGSSGSELGLTGSELGSTGSTGACACESLCVVRAELVLVRVRGESRAQGERREL